MSDSDDSDDSSSIAPEDTLVGGRAKRSNAGNRLSHLLQHLDDEDVKADLLAEEEDDQKDYSASEADDGDVAMESSDDSEDEGKGDDDLNGEKELKKQERLESKRKRKARELVRVQPLKKKVKIAEPVSTDDGTPIPQKKARLAPPDFGPTRHSSRSQTMASAKLTEAKVKESRKRAQKTQEIMRIAAERRAAEAGPELTQADRMRRALEIEIENSKSLNRWERSERDHVQLQKEKLEAMRNRKLDGPVIRYWSGPVTWIWREGPDGHPVYARCKYQKRNKAPVEEPDIERGQSAEVDMRATAVSVDGSPHQDAEAKEADLPRSSNATAETTKENNDDTVTQLHEGTDAEAAKPAPDIAIPSKDHDLTAVEPSQGGDGFLDGIHVYASDLDGHALPAQPAQPQADGLSKTGAGDDNLPERDNETQAPSPQVESTQGADTITGSTDIKDEHKHRDPSPLAQPHFPTSAPSQAGPETPSNQPPNSQPPEQPSQPPASSLPLHSEQAARCLIMLDQFPDLPPSPPISRRASLNTNTNDPKLSSLLIPDSHPPLTQDQSRYLSAKRRAGPTTRVPLDSTSTLPPAPERAVCAISGKTARFRDPRTRLPYADMSASKAIQRVMANGCQFSALLGVWAGIVGEGALGRVARGVPAGFWKGLDDEKIKA